VRTLASRGLRLLITLCLIASSIGALAAAANANANVAASRVATALPGGRVEFGLSNLDTTWMTSSGVPWRYRFQYLAGGVNTSGNWLTWQDPAKPPGQFALDYMTSSTTPPANYIPVFTWYQLLQSTPSIGNSELERDYSNLNNAATMSAYFASFKVLMEKAAQYGGEVVVHVEPDMWGYMQQKAAGGTASSISTMVKSSGFAEASAFPDNLAGFASELKYLRDRYAPNALLAMHASMWSSSIDIASTTDSSVNAALEADKTAAFLNSAGASGWDALFNDVDDHNAAWWELASCPNPPCVNQYFTHWWDPGNLTYPNFSRYLSWVGELHARSGVPQVVWQVPMGNQYFLTMNNTCGHYQDNVAPYFIGHPSELFNAGLIAILFGPGNDCQTSYDDAKKDGITNNGGNPTTDVLGYCNACNTHVSSWADDDGGYLRIFVGRYYAGQTPCSSVTVGTVPGSPQGPGAQISVTAEAAGCTNPLYQFWVLPPGGNAYQMQQAYSTTATFTWNTSALAPGDYRFSIWARDANSAGAYGNQLGRWDAYDNSLLYTLATPACSGLSASAAPASPAGVGTAVSVSAQASGCADPNPLYQFWVLPPGGNAYQLKQAYSTTRTFNWNTTGLAPGDYRFSIWTRDANGTGLSGNQLGRWDAYNNSILYTLTAPACSGLSASAAPASPAGIGTPVAIHAQASGCPDPNPLYQFWVLAPGGTAYQLSQAYSTNSTFSWSTSGLAPGSYRLAIWARDANSSGVNGNQLGRWDAYNNDTLYTLNSCSGLQVSVSPASPAARGTTVTVTAQASGCPDPNPQYQFWVLAPGANAYQLVQAYSASSTLTWNTTGLAPGTYHFSVWVRDTNSAGAQGNQFGTWDAYNNNTVYTLS
jgi:hypothetical protein